MRYLDITQKTVTDTTHGWDYVTSAMSASILHLLQLHIKPSSPTTWLRHRIEGDASSGEVTIDMRCPIQRGEHLQWIEDRLAQAMWSSVTDHEANSGLWKGEPPFIEPTRKIHQKMLADGRVPEAMALQAAVTHNVWCASRATQDRTLILCLRCGGEPETLLHRFWTCNNNAPYSRCHLRMQLQCRHLARLPSHSQHAQPVDGEGYHTRLCQQQSP